MFHLLEQRIAEAFASRIESLYGLKVAVQTEQPKQASFGEIAVPAAFQLARQLKKGPKAIASELSDAVGTIDGIASVEIAGNGYLNLRLDRGYYGAALLVGNVGVAVSSSEKIIVEHTNINPN
jgi:arginyl-tRNA synthetase